MANKKMCLGMAALALTFGLVVMGCPAAEDDGNSNNGPANDNAKLVGKWKAQNDTGDPPTVVFEFLDSGMVNWSGSLVSYTYQGTTLKLSSVTGTAALSDGGATLFISGIGGGADGTYTKIGGNNPGDPDTGGTGAKSIKITGVPSNLSQEEGMVILFNNSGHEVATGGLNKHASGDITLELFDAESPMTSWKGNGNYAVVIFIAGESGSSFYCYLNGASPSSVHGFGSLPKLAFTTTLTTVQFSKFGEVSPENLFGGN